MKLILLPLILAIAALVQDAPAKVVVHEWGTFTSISGDDGAALEWRPLSGPSDLPSFVYEFGPVAPKAGRETPGFRQFATKGGMIASVRMETPVLYFYSDREAVVSVKVDFPKGKVTEWYPSAREVGTGINWGSVRLMPDSRVEFPTEKGESHYYPARETDATPIRVCRQNAQGKPVQENEKFLFYRGVGTFDLPIRVTMEDRNVRIKNLGADALCQVVLFENRGGQMGHRISCGLKDEVVLDRPELGRAPEALFQDLMKILTQQGLYEKEASAMIKTWRDSWFEEGLRVFYIVPRKAVDAILPIAIDPKPAELVRVLVGRVEILTPELEAAIRVQVEKLGEASLEARDAASKALKGFGRFAEPILKKLLTTTDDAEVRVRIQELLRG